MVGQVPLKHRTGVQFSQCQHRNGEKLMLYYLFVIACVLVIFACVFAIIYIAYLFANYNGNIIIGSKIIVDNVEQEPASIRNNVLLGKNKIIIKSNEEIELKIDCENGKHDWIACPCLEKHSFVSDGYGMRYWYGHRCKACGFREDWSTWAFI